eukprot:maker-scaffold240_size241964-snap-gene-1.19 protein:Tk08270 transcript:maker-scaffold240_size241964-snap-gene-1.19-mRNA-1 annotation:"oxidoreductase nad-binding domain-containing protein 1-like"
MKLGHLRLWELGMLASRGWFTSRRLSTHGPKMKAEDPPRRREHLELTAHQTRADQRMDARLVRRQNLSPTVLGFTFHSAHPGTFRAGQWVDFFIPGVNQVGGFSMTSSPQKLADSGHLDLAVKASTWAPALWLHKRAQIGDRVQMKIGGDFFWPNKRTLAPPTHNLILIGGGVGINPLLSILRSVHDLEDSLRPQNTQVLFSAKSEEELIFRSDILEICRSPQMGAHFFVTGPGEAATGRINREHVEPLLQDKAAPYMVYICGPNPMIKDMEGILMSLDIPAANIFYELWW